MLDQLIRDNPDIVKYMVNFEAGQTVFMEQDASQDLYILVSGELDVLKGNKRLSQIKERGALFGEMSLLLDARRTATLKARTDVQAIRIPPEEVKDFLSDCPDVAWEITRYLARRLDEASRILYGLNEFYDQLPDAVTLTDREGQVLSWNAAATNLYGYEWDEMRHKPVEGLYEEPDRYREFLAQVQEGVPVRERVLKVGHPRKGTRFISTSMSVLYDAHHNFQGVLSIGRDVTQAQSVEQRYKTIRNWVIPALLVLFLSVGGAFVAYPYLTKGYLPTDKKAQELKNQLAKDFLLLNSLLREPLKTGDRNRTRRTMQEFFQVQEASASPYTGLLLLTPEKRVFDAFFIDMNEDQIGEMVGNSYAGIPFTGAEDSVHKVLTLYRVDKEHPMGYRCVEVAFEMNRDGDFLGWLLFQLDPEKLEEVYSLDEEALARFKFKEPGGE